MLLRGKNEQSEFKPLSEVINFSCKTQEYEICNFHMYQNTVYSRYLEFQGTGQNMSSYQ